MVEQTRSEAEHLRERLEFEMLFSELSSRFINLCAGELDREITEALRRVCALHGIDLAVLWQWSSVGPGIATPTHVYVPEGMQPPETMSQNQFAWIRQQMLEGRSVALSSLDELPAEAAIDREVGLLLGIKSNLCLPLSVGGELPVGVLGFNTLREHREWPDDMVRRLELFAQILTNALARRRHELNLQESEERLALAADSAEAGIWTLDYGTGVFWATERARTIFGYSPDEDISLESFEASVHPGDWNLVREAIERSARAGEHVDVVYRIVRRGDDCVRWITSRGRSRLDSAGGGVQLMGVSIDITERKHVEEAFRASEARLAAGADLAGLAYYEVNFGEGVLYADARIHDICGIPPERREGLQVLEFWMEHLHPDDRQRVLDLRRRLHEGAVERLNIEYRFGHPTQGEKWLHHIGSVTERDAAGGTVRSFGVLRDITERRRREEELRQSCAELKLLKERLQAESDYLKDEIKVAHQHGEITGQSPAIKRVLQLAEQVAPTGSSVLVCGETGTGKELIARAIHRLSSRRDRLMIKVNCAALPSGLVESELFGREKGAFTGAMTRQIGRFEIADGSTVFLDEIGELSLEIQAKLLRVLEQGEFERLGSPRTIKTDVRLIAATHRDLAKDIQKGRFREDLYYRLNVFPIRVPPLRDRTEDIPLLVWTFLEEFSSRMGKKITQVPRATIDALQRHSWPGNIRELRNVIEHAAILTNGHVLTMPRLDDATPGTAVLTLADVEREHILRVLRSAGWRIKGTQGAAAALGLKPSTLYSRMKKLGVGPRPEDEIST